MPLSKVAKDTLIGSQPEDVEIELENFFKTAAQKLDELGFYLGPITYSVQMRTFNDQVHNGHGVWQFACLRRERTRFLILPDKRYVLSLELNPDENNSNLSFNFLVYTRTHFEIIEGALAPIAEILTKNTGRAVKFHERRPEDVPALLSC